MLDELLVATPTRPVRSQTSLAGARVRIAARAATQSEERRW